MKDEHKKLLGKKIKNIRLNKGLTMEEFGKMLNTSKSSVSMWESGRSLPNKDRLKIIAKLGDLTVDELTSINKLSDQLRDFIHSEESGTSIAIKEITTNIISQFSDGSSDCCSIHDYISERDICDLDYFAREFFYKVAEALINVVETFESEEQ